MSQVEGRVSNHEATSGCYIGCQQQILYGTWETLLGRLTMVFLARPFSMSSGSYHWAKNFADTHSCGAGEEKARRKRELAAD